MVNVSTPTGAVTEAGGQAVFTIALAQEPTAGVRIEIATSDAGEARVTPTELAFAPADWSTPQTLVVTGVDDPVADGDQPVTIVLGALQSTDPAFAGVDPADVTLTNLDDDLAQIVVTPQGTVTSEAGGQAAFTVALTSEPTAEVTVLLASDDPSEGVAGPSSIVFTPATWDTPQLVTVTGADDHVDDGDIAYAIGVSAAGSADAVYAAVAPTSVPLTNTDDDTAGIRVSAASGPTTEAGGQATFTVVLDSEPTADVTVSFASDDLTEGVTSVGSLTFTPPSWSTTRTVTVTGVDDTASDGNVAYQVDFAATTSSDPLYAAIVPPSVNLVNNDNELALCTMASCWPGDDFEDGNIAGWTTHGHTVSVDTTTGANGTTRSLRAVGGNNSHLDGARRNWPGCQPSRFTVWVRPDATTSSARNYIVLGPPSGSSPTNNVVFLYLASEGHWKAVNSTSDVNLGAPAINTWTRVDIDFNWAARNYDVRFNGVLVLDNFAFRNTALTQLGQADFYNYGSATGRWDQIELICQ